MNQEIVITELGMITPVGLSAVQSCASIRAGISRLKILEDYYFPIPEDPEWDDPEDITGAPIDIPSLDIYSYDDGERRLEMMERAFHDLQENAGLKPEDIQNMSLFLSTSPVNKSTEDSSEQEEEDNELLTEDRMELQEKLMEDFQDRIDIRLAGTKLFPYGHAGVYLSVEEAIQRMQAGEFQSCLIGGVDSLLDFDKLEQLDEAYRLKSTRNVDGFIPGEACGFFLLETLETAQRRKADILAVAGGTGTAIEENPIASDRPTLAKGLTKAIQKAIDTDKGEPSFSRVQSDLNGESFRSKEWGLVSSRLSRYFSDNVHTAQHARSIGDVGAATGIVSVAVVASALKRGYAKENQCLLWASSDAGERGAMILRKYEEN